MQAPRALTTPRGVALYALVWCVVYAAFAEYASTIGLGPIPSRGQLDSLAPLLPFAIALMLIWRNAKGVRNFLMLGWGTTVFEFLWPVLVRAWRMTPLKNVGLVMPWAVPLMAIVGLGGMLLTYAYVPVETPRQERGT